MYLQALLCDFISFQIIRVGLFLLTALRKSVFDLWFYFYQTKQCPVWEISLCDRCYSPYLLNFILWFKRKIFRSTTIWFMLKENLNECSCYKLHHFIYVLSSLWGKTFFFLIKIKHPASWVNCNLLNSGITGKIPHFIFTYHTTVAFYTSIHDPVMLSYHCFCCKHLAS